MPLNELLPKAVRLYPKREAIICGDIRISYKEFAGRAWRLCHTLRTMGLEKGDRITILHENCHTFLEAYFASVHLGLILVPLNSRLSTKELAMVLEDSQSRVLIAQSNFVTPSRNCPTWHRALKGLSGRDRALRPENHPANCITRPYSETKKKCRRRDPHKG